MGAALLTEDTYKQGLLVNDSVMTGVVELQTGAFAVFVTEIETARTTSYTEFPILTEALDYINTKLQVLAANLHYEAFGCDKGSNCKGAQKGACAGCSNNSKNPDDHCA